jgi:hypothetical protein
MQVLIILVDAMHVDLVTKSLINTALGNELVMVPNLMHNVS